MCAATDLLVGELPLPDVRAPLHVELGPQLPVLFLALACPAHLVPMLAGCRRSDPVMGCKSMQRHSRRGRRRGFKIRSLSLIRRRAHRFSCDLQNSNREKKTALMTAVCVTRGPCRQHLLLKGSQQSGNLPG